LRKALGAAVRRSLKEHLLALPDAGTDGDFERKSEKPGRPIRL
jgi:hypothetical protein